MKHKRNILIIIIDIFLGVALIYEFGSLGISLFVKMNFTIAFIAIIMMYKRLGIFSYLKYTIGQYLPMVLIPGIALLIFCVSTLYYEPETKLTKSELISLQIPLHRITDSASNGSVFPVVTEHFSASSDHAFL